MEGTSGLRRYRERRTEETEKAPSSKDPGCFHDSEGVLECVRTTHKMLLHDLRKSDTLTEAVLDKIHCMLQPEASRTRSPPLWPMVKHDLDRRKPIHPQRDPPPPVPAMPGRSRADSARPEVQSQELSMGKGNGTTENLQHSPSGNAATPPRRPRPSTKVERPTLSVPDAWVWRDSNRKKSFKDAIMELPHGYWRGDLDNRDHVSIPCFLRAYVD